MFSQKEITQRTEISLGVGVFIKDNLGRILLERRTDCGLWGLPGGKIKPGETVTEAAIREVLEETGYQITITGLVGIYSEPSGRIVTYPDNGDEKHIVDIILEAEVVSGQLTKSEESLELAFFQFTQLPPDIAPPAVIPIKDFFNGVKNTVQ